jgi:hypothetical protein
LLDVPTFTIFGDIDTHNKVLDSYSNLFENAGCFHMPHTPHHPKSI